MYHIYFITTIFSFLKMLNSLCLRREEITLKLGLFGGPKLNDLFNLFQMALIYSSFRLLTRDPHALNITFPQYAMTPGSFLLNICL